MHATQAHTDEKVQHGHGKRTFSVSYFMYKHLSFLVQRCPTRFGFCLSNSGSIEWTVFFL